MEKLQKRLFMGKVAPSPHEDAEIPRDRIPWWRPIFWSGLFVVIQIISVNALALLPLLVLALGLRELYIRIKGWHRPPNSLNIAVIGGGWTGCQVLGKFRDLHVNSVKVRLGDAP